MTALPPVAEGIILAAGASLRAGAFKPALMLGDKPLIRWCIEGMSESCQHIIVVGGYDIGKLRSLLPDTPAVECIENVHHSRGMFSSVKAALSHVRGNLCFILPVDIPLVPGSVYRAVMGVDAPVVVPTFRGNRGHPVCIRRSVISAIMREPDSSSLRDIIQRVGSSTIEVDAEEILLDVDTQEDYERMLQKYRLSGNKYHEIRKGRVQ